LNINNQFEYTFVLTTMHALSCSLGGEETIKQICWYCGFKCLWILTMFFKLLHIQNTLDNTKKVYVIFQTMIIDGVYAKD
jgi:hypothetical protein